MTATHCMMTGDKLEEHKLDEKDTIVVVQGGRVVGVIKPGATENVKTLRLTFTRPTATAYFAALQANGIEFFFDTDLPESDEPY